MSLTPSNVRLDLKCGKGAISPGETCTKGPATKAEAPPTKRKSTPRATKTEKFLKRAGMIGTLGGAAVSLGGIATGNTRLGLHGLAGAMAAAGAYNAGEAMGFERKGQKSKAIAARTGAALGLTYGAGIAISTETALADIRRMQAQTRAQRNTYSGTGGSSFARTSDFMRGYGSASQTTTTAVRNPSRRAYSPPKGSTEWKISQVFKAKIKRNTSSSTNPNPDVSAAWAKARIKTSASPYNGDPDVSAAFSPRRDSVWADGFTPDNFDI